MAVPSSQAAVDQRQEIGLLAGIRHAKPLPFRAEPNIGEEVGLILVEMPPRLAPAIKNARRGSLSPRALTAASKPARSSRALGPACFTMRPFV